MLVLVELVLVLGLVLVLCTSPGRAGCWCRVQHSFSPPPESARYYHGISTSALLLRYSITSSHGSMLHVSCLSMKQEKYFFDFGFPLFCNVFWPKFFER